MPQEYQVQFTWVRVCFDTQVLLEIHSLKGELLDHKGHGCCCCCFKTVCRIDSRVYTDWNKFWTRMITLSCVPCEHTAYMLEIRVRENDLRQMSFHKSTLSDIVHIKLSFKTLGLCGSFESVLLFNTIVYNQSTWKWTMFPVNLMTFLCFLYQTQLILWG